MCSLDLSDCTFLRQSFALYVVGAGLCSARASDEICSSGRSRAPPLQGPRKKVTSIWISNAPSIDGNRSKATSIKPDTPYQAARTKTPVG